jgi:chaperonin cofactor prefoldin
MSDAPESEGSEPTSESSDATTPDIRERFRQFAQPFVDSLDGRLRDQVDKRVDRRVDETLSARLSVIERAIADLDRSIKELQERLDS